MDTQKALSCEIISPETVLNWSMDNVLAVRDGINNVGKPYWWTLMPNKIMVVDRVPFELLPENFIINGNDILIKKSAIPEGIDSLNLTSIVETRCSNLYVTVGRQYNVSPWDINSVILIPHGDIVKNVNFIKE